MALVPKNGNDTVYTPNQLALTIVKALNPKGLILEPCSGGGAFVRAFEKQGLEYISCEIDKGSDFFDFKDRVDWVITNPPWSQARKFLQHSMSVADNIAFLITINHFLALKARFRDMKEKGFWVSEVLLCDTPKEFPQSGFQLGVVVIKKLKDEEKIITKWRDLDAR